MLSFVCQDDIVYDIIKSSSEEKFLPYAQFLPCAGIPNMSEIFVQYEILPVYKWPVANSNWQLLSMLPKS